MVSTKVPATTRYGVAAMAAEAGGGESGRWCVVTGGRGFAARHLVEMLLRTQQWRVKIMDLGPAIKLEPREEEGILGQSLASGDAVYVSADLRNKAQVIKGTEINEENWDLLGF